LRARALPNPYRQCHSWSLPPQRFKDLGFNLAKPFVSIRVDSWLDALSEILFASSAIQQTLRRSNRCNDVTM
jgi:hypothetical protein